MSETQVQVQRRRPVCPFCHDEVVSGHVWVCSGCESQHHAACEQEHGGCASCGLAPAQEQADPKAAEGGTTDAHDTALLDARRRELEALGFEIVQEDPDGLRAMHMGWKFSWIVLPQPVRVEVRRVETLTVERLEADHTQAHTANTLSVACYLADRVDPGAVRWIETRQGCRPMPRFFPAVWRADSQDGIYCDTDPLLLGAALYPQLRFLARRLLFPHLDRETTVEPAFLFPSRMMWVAVILAAIIAVGAVLGIALAYPFG